MTTPAAGLPPDPALDALLAAYAAGSLSAPLHVLVAGHLALTPRSRTFVRSLEGLGAAALEAERPVPVSDRDAMLSAIFAAAEPPASGRAPVAAGDAVLPDPIARYLGRGLDDIRWRTVLPGVKEHKVEKTARGEAVLYWIKPGRKMPNHTHEGSEYTLVLKGGFTEVGGHFRRGDIAIADQEVDHRPVADLDEDCICFAVTDAPLRLTGPVGRVLQRLFGKKPA